MVSLRDVLRIAGQADADELSTLRARIGELEAENARLKGDAEGQTVEGGDWDRVRAAIADAIIWRDATAGDWDDVNAGYLDAILAAYSAAGGNATAELTRLKAIQDFQQRVDPWLIACFGEEIARDQMERNHRFFEEATELVQANGMTASEARQLVDYTYGRPVGEASQEVGGVMVTLAALCLASGLDMHAAAETELARIWTKVEKIRAKQAAKPKHSPLPEHVPASSQPEHDRTVQEGHENA